jgi:hypothetical protein
MPNERHQLTLTGTLADTAKDGVTTVRLCNVVDELGNQHSLADTSTAEKTNLSALGVRGKQINDLALVTFTSTKILLPILSLNYLSQIPFT